MPVPDFQTLMLPVLKHAAPGETRVPDVEAQIADEFGLTQPERDQMLPSGRQKVLHNRIHWAKFYMSKAGLIASPRRGRFVATDAGRALLAQNPNHINIALLRQYPTFEDFYQGGSSEGTAGALPDTSVVASAVASTTTPEEQIEQAHIAVQKAVRSDLIQRILDNSPSFFEKLIVDLLVAMRYGGSHRDAARQLGRTGDGGVDGVINADRLGLDRVYLQAKRYAQGTVGRPEVQAFLGSLVGLGATKGVFVTTSTFSHQALEFVKHLPQRVILIDGERLADLLLEHNVGVRVSRTIEFKRVDEDFFSEEE